MPSGTCSCCDYYFEWQKLEPPSYNVRAIDSAGSPLWYLSSVDDADSIYDICSHTSGFTNYFYVVKKPNYSSALLSKKVFEKYADDAAIPVLQWSKTLQEFKDDVATANPWVGPPTEPVGYPGYYDIPSNCVPHSICNDSSGNLYVGASHAVVVKYDSAGTLQWVKQMLPYPNWTPQPGGVPSGAILTSSGVTYSYSPSVIDIASDGTYVFALLSPRPWNYPTYFTYSFDAIRLAVSDGSFDLTYSSGSPTFTSLDAVYTGKPCRIIHEGSNVYIGQLSYLGDYSFTQWAGYQFPQYTSWSSYGTYAILSKYTTSGTYWNSPAALVWESVTNQDAPSVRGLASYAGLLLSSHTGVQAYSRQGLSISMPASHKHLLQKRSNTDGSSQSTATDPDTPTLFPQGIDCAIDAASVDATNYGLFNINSPVTGGFGSGKSQIEKYDYPLARSWVVNWSDAAGQTSGMFQGASKQARCCCARMSQGVLVGGDLVGS